MREVFEYYGKFIIEGIVVIALLSLVFVGITDREGNRGIYHMTGAKMDLLNIDYRNYADFKECYKAESEKAAPSIYYVGENLETGRHVLAEYIKAVDWAERNLSIRVISIQAPDDTETIGDYNPLTGEITFSQAGVYVVHVVAKDESNKFAEAKIRIPVNYRKREI